jgi:elongation factor G
MSGALLERTQSKGKPSPLVRTRNIGIVAHIDSGKTTITERMLKLAGKIRQLGEVHDGEATMDFMKEEQERGITIGSAATHFLWGESSINLIDTPGHVDFTAEVERSLRVLDGAILAIDSVAGAQAQSETVNRQMNKYDVPRLAFINKMDRVGADYFRAVESLQKRLRLNAVPIQIPVGEGQDFRGLIDLVDMVQVNFPERTDDPSDFTSGPIEDEFIDAANDARAKMLEALSMHSDELMEVLLEDGEPTHDQIVSILRQATIRESFVPVMLGSALRNRGVPALLNAVVAYLPSPIEKGAAQGVDPRTDEPIAFEPDPSAELGAMVFKTVHFSTGDLTFVRIYSGTLESGKGVYNPRIGRHERIGRIFLVHASSREAVETAEAGQIVAVMGIKQSATGDSLCSKQAPIVYGATTFANPVISQAIEPKSSGDRDRLGEVLGIVAREDPTFHVFTDQDTGQTIMSGMGELHLEVVVHRLRDEFRIAVLTGKPRVSYRQTLRKKASFETRHIKQTGGSGQYAVAKFEVEPIEGEEVEVVDTIKGGKITKEYLDAIAKGIREHALTGGRRGAKIQGFRATIVDGKMHDVDSSAIAFYACGVQSGRTAEQLCGTVVLEPIMRVVVTMPEVYLGTVIGDLNSRMGVVEQISDEGMVKKVEARVPLRTLPAYATTLRSITSGRGEYSMEPDGYQPVPVELVEDLED